MSPHDVDGAQARPVSSRAEAAIVEKLSYHRQHSEKKNVALMNRITAPIIDYFRNRVYLGKGDLVLLDDDLTEVAQKAEEQRIKTQESVLDKLSRKKTQDLNDILTKKDIVYNEIRKDFPKLKDSESRVLATVFEDMVEFETFRNRAYVQEAIKNNTIEDFLDVYTGTKADTNTPYEERSLFSKYLTDKRTGTRDADALAKRLQGELSEKTAEEVKTAKTEEVKD